MWAYHIFTNIKNRNLLLRAIGAELKGDDELRRNTLSGVVAHWRLETKERLVPGIRDNMKSSYHIRGYTEIENANTMFPYPYYE